MLWFSVGILAAATVPVAIAEPFKLVIFEPLIAAAVPDNCAAGKLVRFAPLPYKVSKYPFANLTELLPML